MRNNIILIIILLSITSNLTFGQGVHFTSSGVVEYQKTVNVYAILKRQVNTSNESSYKPMLLQYQKSHPQFKTLNSSLIFTNEKTIFTPIPEEVAPVIFLGTDAILNQNNTTFTNLKEQVVISEKKIFEKTYLLKDKIRKIRWKITDETRTIASYPCRRANALVDSMYVVAFFTEQIPVSGGPESFTGLPGMILQLALPHENITWMAIKVTESSVAPKSMAIPARGTLVNRSALYETINETIKNWGQNKQSILRALLL